MTRLPTERPHAAEVERGDAACWRVDGASPPPVRSDVSQLKPQIDAQETARRTAPSAKVSRAISGVNSARIDARPDGRTLEWAKTRRERPGAPCATTAGRDRPSVRTASRNRGDSGSTHAMLRPRTIGTTPPKTKSVRQPSGGSARMPSRPAIVAPSGTHTMVT